MVPRGLLAGSHELSLNPRERSHSQTFFVRSFCHVTLPSYGLPLGKVTHWRDSAPYRCGNHKFGNWSVQNIAVLKNDCDCDLVLLSKRACDPLRNQLVEPVLMWACGPRQQFHLRAHLATLSRSSCVHWKSKICIELNCSCPRALKNSPPHDIASRNRMDGSIKHIKAMH